MRYLPFAGLLLLGSCTDAVTSDEDAERAYMGLDAAVDRAIVLGFTGFNAASSANIDPQSDDGDSSGTMVITGSVDQGASDNKGMRLHMALVDYSDTWGEDDQPDLRYDTDPDDAPALALQLKGIPDGTLEGTLAGPFAVSGQLHGFVELDLTFSGELESDDVGGTRLHAAGTTIRGSATSEYGTYTVDLVR